MLLNCDDELSTFYVIFVKLKNIINDLFRSSEDDPIRVTATPAPFFTLFYKRYFIIN